MINIQDIIPFMKKGWVAMDYNGEWWWYEEKPYKRKQILRWLNRKGCILRIINTFDIEPVEDWKKSLIEVKDES